MVRYTKIMIGRLKKIELILISTLTLHSCRCRLGLSDDIPDRIQKKPTETIKRQ